MNSPGYEDSAQPSGLPFTRTLPYSFTLELRGEESSHLWEDLHSQHSVSWPLGDNGWPNARVTGHQQDQHSALYETEIKEKFQRRKIHIENKAYLEAIMNF